MKIAFICLCRSGGTLLCGRKLASALIKHKNNDLLFIGSENASFGCIDDLEKSNVKQILVKTGNSLVQNIMHTLNFKTCLNIIKQINIFKPDIIHFAVPHIWNTFLSLKLKKYPIFCTIHDPVRHSGDKSLIQDSFTSIVLAIADRVIVLSSIFKNSFKKYGKSSEKVSVLRHGSLENKNGYYPPKNNRNVLFIGRIESYKGVEYLINAFYILKNKKIEFELTIAGRGNIEKYFNKHPLENNLKLINKWLSEEEIDELCENADFVVLPYIDGTQSGIVAKAQAVGRPVIITNVGGLPEQIIDNITGIIIAPRSAKELSEKIEFLLENKKVLSKMSVAAYELYREKYNWDSIAVDAIEIYKQGILDRKFSGPSKTNCILKALIASIKSNLLKNVQG